MKKQLLLDTTLYDAVMVKLPRSSTLCALLIKIAATECILAAFQRWYLRRTDVYVSARNDRN